MWDIIVESNTFNFIIMLVIFAIIAKAIKLPDILNGIKQGIVKSIDEANAKKELAEKKLIEAKELNKSLEDDLKNNIKNAQKRAKAVEEQILSEANSKIHYIEKNVENIIRSEEKSIANITINNTLKESARLAKEQIISKLKENPELHNKYIEESIKAIR